MLSVCLITRNEEASLPRALQSVRDVAGEIIVADTGSTDRTDQIAKDFGATVVHFPWCDDFSAARNFAIGQAHGDWIFWLDADEELLPESLSELRSSMARTEALAYFVRRQDLQDANRLDYFTTMWQLRLFRRREDLKFIGRCHPHFEPSEWEVAEKTGQQVLQSPITMRHYGYVGELRPAKLQRGARLLEMELRDHPGQLYYLVEFGRTLLVLGEEKRGHEILCQAMAQVIPRLNEAEIAGPVVAQLLEYFLMLPAERLPAGLTAELLEAVTRRWFLSSAPLVWLLARRAADSGQLEDSERLLRRLVQMGAEQSYDQWVSFDPRLVGSDAKLNLGVCLVRQNKIEEARSIFTGLLASPDRAREAQ
ncbi:MAG: hypothetical protein QOD03_1248, partial [Verrucomicrobiota bacterium]